MLEKPLRPRRRLIVQTLERRDHPGSVAGMAFPLEAMVGTSVPADESLRPSMDREMIDVLAGGTGGSSRDGKSAANAGKSSGNVSPSQTDDQAFERSPSTPERPRPEPDSMSLDLSHRLTMLADLAFADNFLTNESPLSGTPEEAKDAPKNQRPETTLPALPLAGSGSFGGATPLSVSSTDSVASANQSASGPTGDSARSNPGGASTSGSGTNSGGDSSTPATYLAASSDGASESSVAGAGEPASPSERNASTPSETDHQAAAETSSTVSSLDQIAEKVQAADATIFGATWCSACDSQKQFFGDAAARLPYIELANGDGTPNRIAIAENIQSTPTWRFPIAATQFNQQHLESLGLPDDAVLIQADRIEIQSVLTPSQLETLATLSDPSLPSTTILVRVGRGQPPVDPIDRHERGGFHRGGGRRSDPSPRLAVSWPNQSDSNHRSVRVDRTAIPWRSVEAVGK